jgi:hypothetical protein
MEFIDTANSRKLENLSTRNLFRIRLNCSFPIVIKGFNTRGEHYEEVALVENIGWRGLCFRTDQALIPGSIITLYNTEDELDPIAILEVIWAASYDGKIKRVGAQVVGENCSWLRYLVLHAQIPAGSRIITRGRSNISH